MKKRSRTQPGAVLGRRIGGGFEIPSIVEAQREEREKQHLKRARIQQALEYNRQMKQEGEAQRQESLLQLQKELQDDEMQSGVPNGSSPVNMGNSPTSQATRLSNITTRRREHAEVSRLFQDKSHIQSLHHQRRLESREQQRRAGSPLSGTAPSIVSPSSRECSALDESSRPTPALEGSDQDTNFHLVLVSEVIEDVKQSYFFMTVGDEQEVYGDITLAGSMSILQGDPSLNFGSMSPINSPSRWLQGANGAMDGPVSFADSELNGSLRMKMPSKRRRAPTDVRQHLQTAIQSSNPPTGSRKAWTEMGVTQPSQEMFALVFSFVYCSFFRCSKVEEAAHRLKLELPDLYTRFLLDAANRGHSIVADGFPWIIAQGVSNLILKIADPRLHGWFTESCWDRVFMLTSIVITGNTVTQRFARHIRQRFFPSDAKAAAAAAAISSTRYQEKMKAQREVGKTSIAQVAPVQKKRKEGRGKEGTVGKLRCFSPRNFQKSLHKAIGGDGKGTMSSEDTQLFKRMVAGEQSVVALSREEDEVTKRAISYNPTSQELEAPVDAGIATSEYCIFNTTLVADVDNARGFIRQRAQEASDNQRNAFETSEATAAVTVDSLKQEGERDTEKLRAAAFLRSSTPSGLLKMPFESDTQYTMSDLLEWEHDLMVVGKKEDVSEVTALPSPRCHPLAERLAQSLFDTPAEVPVQHKATPLITSKTEETPLFMPIGRDGRVHISDLSGMEAHFLPSAETSFSGAERSRPTTVNSTLPVAGATGTKSTALLLSETSIYENAALHQGLWKSRPASEPLRESYINNSLPSVTHALTMKSPRKTTAKGKQPHYMDSLVSDAPNPAKRRPGSHLAKKGSVQRSAEDPVVNSGGNASSFTFSGNARSFLRSRQGILKRAVEEASVLKGDGSIDFVCNRQRIQQQVEDQDADPQMAQIEAPEAALSPPLSESTLNHSAPLGQSTLNFSAVDEPGVLNESSFTSLAAETKQQNRSAVETLAGHLFGELDGTPPRPQSTERSPPSVDKPQRAQYDSNAGGFTSPTVRATSTRAATPSILPPQPIRSSTPHSKDGKPATPTTNLREAAGGVIQQQIRFSGMTPSLSSVVPPTQASRHSKSMPTTHLVPRSQQATRDLHIVLATQEKNEKKYQQQREVESAQYKREMKAHNLSAKHEQDRLNEITKDPLKRSDFTLDLVREGRIKRVPDRMLHPEHFKGTFLAEAAKETSLQTRDIFRRLEASWAAARRRRKVKVAMGKA